MKDTVTGKVFDPTFGTSGNFNPTGVRCTSTTMEGMKMISVYGAKYKIIRSAAFEAELLLPLPVADKDVVDDADFI